MAFIQVSKVLRPYPVSEEFCGCRNVPLCWQRDTVSEVCQRKIRDPDEMTAFDLWLCKRILHPQSISSNDRLKAAVGVRQRKCVLSRRECQSRDVMPVAPGCHAGCIRQEGDFPNGIFKAKCFDAGCGFRAGQRPGVGFEQHFNVHVLGRRIAPEDRQIESAVLQIGPGIDRFDLERNVGIGAGEVGQPRAEPPRDEPAVGAHAQWFFNG